MSSRIFLGCQKEKKNYEVLEAAVFDLTRIDDYPGDGGAVTTDPLGRTVADDICPEVNGTDQVP